MILAAACQRKRPVPAPVPRPASVLETQLLPDRAPPLVALGVAIQKDGFLRRVYGRQNGEALINVTLARLPADADGYRRWVNDSASYPLIEQVRPLLVTGDDFFVSSGLDFWFTPGGAKIKVPVRWKQYLITWSAIYPLALVAPLIVTPALRGIGAENRLLTTLAVTGTVVFMMVYVVMPRYTRLVKRWLFS